MEKVPNFQSHCPPNGPGCREPDLLGEAEDPGKAHVGHDRACYIGDGRHRLLERSNLVRLRIATGVQPSVIPSDPSGPMLTVDHQDAGRPDHDVIDVRQGPRCSLAVIEHPPAGAIKDVQPPRREPLADVALLHGICESFQPLGLRLQLSLLRAQPGGLLPRSHLACNTALSRSIDFEIHDTPRHPYRRRQG